MRKRMWKSIIYSSLITLVVLSNLFIGLAEETYTWEEKTSMNEGRDNCVAVKVDDKIYAIGGRASTADYSKSMEQYTPALDTWETKSSLAFGRKNFGATNYNGKIYVFGGFGEGGVYLNSVEVYNPVTNTWLTKTDMPISRALCKTITVGSKVYVFGGKNSSGYIQQVDVYDPATDTWETKSSMAYGRQQFSLVDVNSKVYIIGGTIFDGTTSTVGNKVEVYNTITDTWETAPDMLTSKSTHEAITYNGKIYVLFGTEYSQVKGIDIFDLSTNVWSTASLNPFYGVSDFGCVLIGNKVFIVGGSVHNESGGTAAKSKRTIALTIPLEISSAPTNLTATPANAQVALNWDVIDGADSYNVKRSTTQGGPYTTIASNVTTTTYIDTNVTNGITYYYVVTAVNTAGESEPSNEASATPIAPVVNRALLNITMQNSLIKEYDMSMTEVETFISWYNNTSGSKLYTIDKSYNIGSFLNRKDYIVKDMIVCFEIMEYKNIE